MNSPFMVTAKLGECNIVYPMERATAKTNIKGYFENVMNFRISDELKMAGAARQSEEGYMEEDLEIKQGLQENSSPGEGITKRKVEPVDWPATDIRDKQKTPSPGEKEKGKKKA